MDPADRPRESEAAAAVHLTLAGAATLHGPAGPLVALGPRDAALLAWLALEGVTPRAKLASLIWPEHDIAAGRNNLRQRIFKLRKHAGTDVVIGSAGLQLAASVEHDLGDAEGLLADVPDEVGGEFSNWLAQQRQRRRDRVRRALVELIEMAEQAKDYADALTHATELMALEPLSEDAHRRVIRLHYLSGDRAAALLAFDRCERVLKDEVGTQPSPQTLALLATLSSAGPQANAVACPVPASVLRPPLRAGRDDVWAALCTSRETGATVLLAGEPGMGKSRLLNDLVQESVGGNRWLATCTARAGDATVPFATLARLVRTLLERSGIAPPPEIREALAHVMPEWSDARKPIQVDPRTRVAGALEYLWSQARNRGLCASVVDDLHAADDASVEALQGLISCGLGGWILAMRRTEIGPTTTTLLNRLEAAPGTLCLELSPLSATEIETLLESLGVDGLVGGAHAEALSRLTGGNPLYILETIKAALSAPEGIARGAWPSAPNVLRLIQKRLAHLSSPGLQVARCVAVAGQDSSPPLIAAVLGQRPIELADAWLEVEAAQLLRDGQFAHDLMAQATLATLPSAIARSLHADVALWLEGQGAEPGRISAHWLAASEPRRAVPTLLAAAGKARDAWRSTEAAAFFEKAAGILREAGDQLGAFEAYFAAADTCAQHPLGARFMALHEALDSLARDDGQQAMLALMKVQQLIESRHFEEARSLIALALPKARMAGLPEIEANLLWGMAGLQWHRRAVSEAAGLAEQALALLSAVAPENRRLHFYRSDLELIRALGLFYSASARYAEGDARLLQAHRMSSAVGLDDHLLTIEQILANNALDQGDLASAQRWGNSVLARLARVAELTSHHVLAAALCGAVLATSGELGAALASFDRAAALCDRQPTPRTHVFAMLRHALFWFDLGRKDLAVRGLNTLRGTDNLSAAERANVEAALITIGEKADIEMVLEPLDRLDDFPLQVRLLCLAARGCDAARLLRLLDLHQERARDCGAHGLWLGLQLRRVATLQATGEHKLATAAALQAWRHIDEGIWWTDLLPSAAALLCPSLVENQPELAEVIALRAYGWMNSAAATLTPEWRENYLNRAPPLEVLRALRIVPAATRL
ncbi:DNA-binding transcriptional activator of the SARP family [Burkholderiales bacterium JOSHI_001]|nr:DNA-binding transcriptional activator of the SARP family [Burkholderiales bacterium JOSHI_001]